ncbi:MAG: MBL fold metallo-hydrolase, partial [Geobacteraceae bacterium]
MDKRQIKEKIYWLGAVDWDRRLFDSLIPLPDGTTYNAYLIEGSQKTALLDTVDPAMADELMAQLDGVSKIDFIVSHHAEQDHSGAIPRVLDRFPEAKVVVNPKAKGMLIDLLKIPENAFVTVEDGETLSLGDKTLKFVHTPWVHWPETMVTYLEEDRILFSCDFFGSHIAATDLFVTDKGRVYEAAKRYFAEIMMPFRGVIEKNIEKLKSYDVEMIAPSHGQIYDHPAWIMEAYRDWITGAPHNLVVLPFVSMHGSTRKMVDHLTSALVGQGVRV